MQVVKRIWKSANGLKLGIIIMLVALVGTAGCVSSGGAKLAEQVPAEKIDNFADGKEAYKRNDYEKALKIFKNISESDSADWRAHNWLAWTYDKLHKDDLACESFKKSFELSPQESNLKGLARCYFMKNDYENSIYYLRRALEKNPENGVTYKLLGKNYLMQKKYDQAIENFKIANQFSQQPDNYEGLVQAYLAKRQYEDSLFFFKRYADLKGKDVYPYDGFVYLANGDFTKAKLVFNEKKLVGMEIKSDSKGIGVISVHKNTPAAVAGIKTNDIIVKFNGNRLEGESPQEFVAMIRKCRWGDTVPIVFQRGGEIRQSGITIGITDGLIAKIAWEKQLQDGKVVAERAKAEEPLTSEPQIIQGEAVMINQEGVKIQYFGAFVPVVGDPVQIGFKDDDDEFFEVEGDWRIVKANSQFAWAKAKGTDRGEPSVGYIAVIKSMRPKKRSGL